MEVRMHTVMKYGLYNLQLFSGWVFLGLLGAQNPTAPL